MLKPRQLTHRGTVEADGFFFNTTFLPEREARRRILALWVPGAGVHRITDGLVLRLPVPRRIAASGATGTPLVLFEGLLIAAPLRPDEMGALTAPTGALIRVCGGAAVVEALSAANEVDPAQWLGVDSVTVAPVESLGAAPNAIATAVEPMTFEARKRLGGIPPAVPELASVIEALRNPTASSSSQMREPAWWERLLRAANPTGAPAAPGALRIPATPNPLWDHLRRMAAQLVLRADLTGRLARRQADYIARMMEMFEQGDMDAALRHAIPLGDTSGDGSPIPSLSVPRPREDLTIHPQTSTAKSTLGFGPELFQNLQTMYRNAFERLEREGRIEEAAFILADLLHVSAEAVAFLEKHGRLILAAEMAEARDLPTGLIVRQWFLAGESDRAVRIARRTGAFADAVVRLEKTNPDAAKTLRTLWAQSLARAGDYAGAVDVLWPVTEARPIARNWIERSLMEGGVSGAKMLARLLTLTEAGDTVALREQAQALLLREDREGAAERQAFVAELVTGKSTPLTAAMARLAVRGVGRDVGAGFRQISPNALRQLVQFAGDGALRADAPTLPALPLAAKLVTFSAPVEIRIAATDAGTMPVYDAAFLPNGRCLVALGEAGCRLVARDGHTIAHIDSPAHRLVVSDSGNHALLLAPRGAVWSVARLDIAARRARPWNDVALTAFAPDYDGSLWFVATATDFVAIDATAEKFESLWRMPNITGTIRSIARSKTQASFLVEERTAMDSWGNPSQLTESWERWTWELPALILRHRTPVPFATASPLAPPLPLPSVSPAGFCLQFGRAAGSAPATAAFYQLYPPPPTAALKTDTEPGAGDSPTDGDAILGVCSDKWAFLATRAAEGITGHLISTHNSRRYVRVRLEGATTVASRLTDETVTVSDNRGRVLVVSLEDGTVLRNLRLG